MGQFRPLFVYFYPFLNTMKYLGSTKFDYKKHRWCAWDLNPEPQDDRRGRIQ